MYGFWVYTHLRTHRVTSLVDVGKYKEGKDESQTIVKENF